MPEFDVDKFKEAIFNQDLFSVPLSSQKSVKKTQNKPEKDQPKTTGGRVWKNIKDSISSKFHRKSASQEIREILVGNDHAKITNKNILNYLSKNIESIENNKDLFTLRATVTALRGFGADPKKCLEIENSISNKMKNIASQRKQKFKETTRRLKRTDRQAAEKAMEKNLKKALHDHTSNVSVNNESFVTSKELENIQAQDPCQTLLNFEAAPIRSQDNDPVRFLKSIKIDDTTVGQLTGIFEGHGESGIDVAQLAGKAFSGLFSGNLKKSEGNVLVAFEQSFAALGTIIGPIKGGSTAIISYIDKKTSKVYTATLGNCEAIAAREFDGKLKLIPLSPIRNWRTDAERTSKDDVDSPLYYLNEELVNVDSAQIEEYNLHPENLYIKSTDTKKTKGILMDMSRAVGDAEYSHEGRGIINKPKVSVFQLQPGDRFFAGGSEIFRNLSPKEMLTLLENYPVSIDFASSIYSRTIQKMRESEFEGNTSVIVFDVSPPPVSKQPPSTPP